MFFVIVSQICIILVNLIMLILFKLESEFNQLIYIIPVAIYSVSMAVYYILFLREGHEYGISSGERAGVVSAIAINLFYAITEIFIEDPENPVLFYIITTVIQVVNLIFLFNHMKRETGFIMESMQEIVHRIFSYGFVFLSVITLLSYFVNTLITVLLLMATAFFSLVATTMFWVAQRNQGRY